MSKLISVEFEVFGKVQGVFFRKHTEKEATRLALKGWVMNTREGSVRGLVQGSEQSVTQMKEWLKKTGSPKSRIDKAVFGHEKEIDSLEFSCFEIRK